jgi:hypothetical protein
MLAQRNASPQQAIFERQTRFNSQAITQSGLSKASLDAKIDSF